VTNEIPNDQKIPWETHFTNDVELFLEPLFVRRIRTSPRDGFRKPPLEAALCFLGEKSFEIRTGREGIFRQV